MRLRLPWWLIACAAGGCYTTLEPVRGGLAECREVDIAQVQYSICEQPLDHASAARDCELRGAHLASLESADENEALAAGVFSSVTSSNVWLGGTRSDDLVWSWPSGQVFWRGGRDGQPEPGAFVLWQPEEPNNVSSSTGEPEACLALTAEKADWNDRSCSLSLPYVCEAD